MQRYFSVKKAPPLLPTCGNIGFSLLNKSKAKRDADVKSLPNVIIDALRTMAGLPGERGLVAWTLCDKRLGGAFADTYVVLAKEALYIVATEPGDTKAARTFAGFIPPRRGRVASAFRGGADRWTKAPGEADSQEAARVIGVETVPLAEIRSAAAVELVASGMLVVETTSEGQRPLAAYMNGRRKEAAAFVSAVNNLKNGTDQKSNAANATNAPHTAHTANAAHDDSEASSCPKCGALYPEKDRRVCPRCMKKGAIFLRLLAMTATYKSSIALIVLFMLLNSAASLVIPYLSGTVFFDQALGNTGPFAGKLGLVIALIIASQTLSLVFSMLFTVVNAKMAAKVFFDLKAGIFASLQRLSLSFFQKKQTGQLMTRVNNDATELQYFFVDGISYFLVNALNMVGILAIMLALDWRLTLISIIPLPFVLLLIRWAFPRLWRLSWRRHVKVSALNSVVSDSVRGTRVVKAFGKERREIERFGRANTAFSGVEQSFNRMNQTVFPLIWMLTQLGGILIWSFGGWSVMQGEFSFGQVMTFVNYLVMLYGPVQFMNNVAGWWSYCMSAAQRIFEIQDAVPEVAEKPDAVHLERLRGDIEVRDVIFGYEPNKPILKKVSLHAKPGTMVGIVGPSGAGKSTLVNLISRLYDVSEGEIRIDGVNVKDLTKASLRDHIGIVSQEVYVFMGTIAENIAYAQPDCTLEEILHAARIANAHDFIEKLPDGYDTIVGTGGHQLSGGEKQRLSIARAVLQSPRILILDEATAALDTETELQIQEALEALMRGRTTIAIAHRLSTLRSADYLVVMQNGEVAEEGSHEQLMTLDRVYAGMVRKHDEALQRRGVG